MSSMEELENDEIRVRLLDKSREKVLSLQKNITQPVEFKLCGYNFIGYPGVFWLDNDPVLEFLGSFPKEEKPKSHVLEIGCGTGWASVVHYFRNKENLEQVLAVDINKDAVNNTIENFKRHQIPGTARYSDVFDSITEDEKFDTIFWNAPFAYAPAATENLSDLDKSLIDPGYRSIEKFVAGAHKHLNKDGRAIITFCKAVGQLGLLDKIAEKYHQRLETICSKEFELSTKVVLELVQIMPAKM